MTNILNLIAADKESHKTLITIGKLGSELDLETYLVGGFVRDLFLNRPRKEIDVMVVGDGIDFARRLARRLGVKKIVPFPQFSTAKIPSQPLPIEVAAARKESYQPDSRKPDRVQYSDLKGDLLRRDFSVNAMAVNILPEHFGELHDPLGGINDLQAKRLVTPLDPDVTFSEDPLRMIRAAYFAAALDFKIDQRGLASMPNQAERISIVSPERITAELIKILETNQPSVGLTILQEAGLMEHIFPEIHALHGMDQTREWHHKDIFYHTLQVVDNAARLSDKMELRFAALVHDIAKPRTRRVDKEKGYTFHGHDDLGGHMLDRIARRMRLPNDLRDYLKKLTLLHLRPIALASEGITDSAVRRLMVAAGEDIDDLLTLCRADITSKNPARVKRYLGNFERVEARMRDVTERDAMKAFQSPLRGDEIMSLCGIPEGRLVGRIKSAIEEAILSGEIENSYAAAREYLLRIKDDFTTDNQPENEKGANQRRQGSR